MFVDDVGRATVARARGMRSWGGEALSPENMKVFSAREGVFSVPCRARGWGRTLERLEEQRSVKTQEGSQSRSGRFHGLLCEGEG